MGIGMLDRPENFPDTQGIREYRVNKIIKQRVGDEIHFLCGSESFGQTHWHVIITMKATDVVVEATESRNMAIDAIAETTVKMAGARH